MGEEKKYEYATDEDQPMIDRMNRELGLHLTLQDYDDWLDGGLGYDRFDNAVGRLLGPGVYGVVEKAARTDYAFLYAMGVATDPIIGGVDLRKLGVTVLKERPAPKRVFIDVRACDETGTGTIQVHRCDSLCEVYGYEAGTDDAEVIRTLVQTGINSMQTFLLGEWDPKTDTVKMLAGHKSE